jgi:hypothetical protein
MRLPRTGNYYSSSLRRYYPDQVLERSEELFNALRGLQPRSFILWLVATLKLLLPTGIISAFISVPRQAENKAPLEL